MPSVPPTQPQATPITAATEVPTPTIDAAAIIKGFTENLSGVQEALEKLILRNLQQEQENISSAAFTFERERV